MKAPHLRDASKHLSDSLLSDYCPDDCKLDKAFNDLFSIVV
jgi:hypothetical protein